MSKIHKISREMKFFFAFILRCDLVCCLLLDRSIPASRRAVVLPQLEGGGGGVRPDSELICGGVKPGPCVCVGRHRTFGR